MWLAGRPSVPHLSEGQYSKYTVLVFVSALLPFRCRHQRHDSWRRI